MRILVYGLSGLRGGVESFIENYCLAVARINPNIQFEFVVIDSIPSYAKTLQDKGFTFHVVPNRIPKLKENRQALRKIVKEGRYDCLWYNVCTLSDITAIEEAEGLVPTIALHAHNSQNMGNIANHFLHNLHKTKAARIANLLLSCSPEASQFMFPKSSIDGPRHHIIPNGIDVNAFRFNQEARREVRSELGWESSTVYVNVGRLSRQKNPLFTLQLFKEIKKRQPNAHLAFIGDGDMRSEVEETITQLGLNSSVDLLGIRKDAGRLLAGADLFLFPSLFEGFPIALIEAQASGLPCLASDAITKGVFLTKHATALSLNETPAFWAEAALKTKSRTPEERLASADAVACKGYAIDTCANEVIDLFENAKNNRLESSSLDGYSD